MSDNDERTIIDYKDDSEQTVYDGGRGPSREDQPFSEEEKSWFQRAKEQFMTTFAIRNPIANALITICWLAGIIPATLVLLAGIVAMFCITAGVGEILASILMGLILIYYALFYIYYSSKFLLGNQKSAKLPFLIGALAGIYLVVVSITIINTPTWELNEMESKDYLFGLLFGIIPAIILVAIYYGIIRLILMIRKDGASAWSLMEPKLGKRSKFDRLALVIFLILGVLSVILVVLDEYLENHPQEATPASTTAKIGDYYYQDGTISSKLLSDKKPIGVVFSLETPQYDKDKGYTHGQIVSLSDISETKRTWDDGVYDYDRYPNYTWENRLDALKDINGFYYLDCDDNAVLPMSWATQEYQENENEGISKWYVPTAGQWALILENLGGTEVDRMLKFDSETASQNLQKVNIDPKKWYWTITEFDEGNAWSIRLANGEFGSRSEKTNRAYVRPVASF